jgi:hypothetical protein
VAHAHQVQQWDGSKVAVAVAAEQRGGEDWQQRRARLRAKHKPPTELHRGVRESGYHRFLMLMTMMMKKRKKKKKKDWVMVARQRRALRGKRSLWVLQRASNGATAARAVEGAAQQATTTTIGATAQRTRLL